MQLKRGYYMSNKINVLHQTEDPVYGSVGHPLLLKIVVSTADFIAEQIPRRDRYYFGLVASLF